MPAGSTVTMTINLGDIAKKSSVRACVDKIVKQRVLEAHGDMLQAFNDHDVTKEIEGGPTAPRKVLSRGNLFAFIGFRSGTQPTELLRNLLRRRPLVRRGRVGKVKKNSINFLYFVTPFKEKEIFSATPLPWERGKSWVRGIEKGISGFGAFIFTTSRRLKNSRSGTGLQVKSRRIGGDRSFKGGIDYLGAIRKEFERSLTN